MHPHLCYIKKVNIGENTRVIVHTRPDKLGDHVLLIPLLHQLSTRTHCHITVITSSTVAPFLQLFSFINSIILIDIHTSHSDMIRNYLSQIKNKSFDIWISFWNDSKMAYLALRSGIQIRIGDASIFPLSLCYTTCVMQNWRNPLRHQIDYYDSMASPLGIRSALSPDLIPVSPSLKTSFELMYEPIKEIKVLIFLETGGTNLAIPIPTIQLVIIELERLGYHITICAQKQYDGFGQRTLNMTGKQLSIDALIALLSCCDIYIGGDTAPTHLASLLQKPILFFSPMKNHSPARWGPMSPYQVILRKDYRCVMPCQPICHEAVCLEWVTPERVKQAFLELIQATTESQKSTMDIYQYHAHHTLRCLKLDYQNSPISELTQSIQAGVLTWNLSIQYKWWPPHWLTIIDVIESQNINIIIGYVPLVIKWIIQIYIGVVAKKIPPLYWNNIEVMNHYLKEKAFL